jgi:hypothetical protein
LLILLGDPEDGCSVFLPNPVKFYQATQLHIPEDTVLYIHHHENPMYHYSSVQFTSSHTSSGPVWHLLIFSD